MPPDTSTKGDTTQEGADTPIQRQPYQQKQCPEAIWECVRDNKLEQLQLNNLNPYLYAFTFGPQNVLPMAYNISKNCMRLN